MKFIRHKVSRTNIILICGILLFSTAIFFYFTSTKRNLIAAIDLYYDQCHRPALKLLTKDSKKYVVIDTGQSRDFGIKNEIFQDLPLIKTKKFHTTYNVYGDKFQEPVFFLKKINCDSWVIRNIHSSINRSPKTNHLKVTFTCTKNHHHIQSTCTLGMGVLLRNNFLIDNTLEKFYVYKKGYIPKEVKEKSLSKVSFITNQNLPIINLDTDQGKKKFLVDLGSPLSILAEKSQSDFVNIFQAKGFNRVILEISLENQLREKKAFIFFGKNFEKMDIDGILGCDLLGKYNMFFDTKNRVIYFLPT